MKKYTLILLLSLLFYLEPQPVMAHDHDRDIILKITLNAELSKAVALALATNHPFTYDTYKWQASVNGAFYNGENALSLGIAKRFEKIDALWHSSYGQNGGNSAITFGSVWRF